MSIEFGLNGFLQPIEILQIRRLFQRMPSAPPEELDKYQTGRLRAILGHAERFVPYYRDRMKRAGLSAADIRSTADIIAFPILTKDDIRREGPALTSEQAAQFHPIENMTSGTTGQALKFLLDRKTNAVEFNYYWRLWNTAGYRLGEPFAEFRVGPFLSGPASTDDLIWHQRWAGRLVLNGLRLSADTLKKQFAAARQAGVRYLKGQPSVVHIAALLAREHAIPTPPLRAIFLQAEVILPHQRRAISETFNCPIFDSYGQQERVLGIATCPQGSYHVNGDFGLAQYEPLEDTGPAGGSRRMRLIGTGLHNYSMPLVRYDTGDVVEINDAPRPCPCGSQFPTVLSIEGRRKDVVVSPDGEMIPSLFVALDFMKGLKAGRFVQDAIDEVRVCIVKENPAPPHIEEHVREVTLRFLKPGMRVRVEVLDSLEAFLPQGRKLRTVESRFADRLLDK